MRTSQALRVLAELSASQWGMVTAAQAAAHGVQRLDLSRLSKAGHLERVAHGVYRDAGAPSDEFESVRAAWLAADPSQTAEERLGAISDDVVVMGESATSLHGVGDLPADRHELSTAVRRQTQRPDVRYRQRQLERGDVTIAHGLPVTTIERTIVDLVENRTDLSLVAHVLRDAARTRRLDTDRLAELLAPLAARNNLPKGDGAALLHRLNVIAGLDSTALAREMATSETVSALVAANNLSRFVHPNLSHSLIGPATEQALRVLNESMTRSVQQAIAPALARFAASVDASRLTEVEATASAIAERVSLNLPTRELLASFGEEWSASIGKAVAADGADLTPVMNAIEAALHVQAVSSDE